MIHHAQCSHVVVADQNNGDLRIVPASDMTLFFERIGVGKQNAQRQKTNEQGEKPFRFGATAGLQLGTTARLVNTDFTRSVKSAFCVAYFC